MIVPLTPLRMKMIGLLTRLLAHMLPRALTPLALAQEESWACMHNMAPGSAALLAVLRYVTR